MIKLLEMLVEYRNEHNLSYEEIAESIGVSVIKTKALIKNYKVAKRLRSLTMAKIGKLIEIDGETLYKAYYGHYGDNVKYSVLDFCIENGVGYVHFEERLNMCTATFNQYMKRDFKTTDSKAIDIMAVIKGDDYSYMSQWKTSEGEFAQQVKFELDEKEKDEITMSAKVSYINYIGYLLIIYRNKNNLSNDQLNDHINKYFSGNSTSLVDLATRKTFKNSEYVSIAKILNCDILTLFNYETMPSKAKIKVLEFQLRTGKTNTDIVNALGVSRQAFYLMLRNNRIYRMQHKPAIKLANIIGCKPSEII